MKRKIKRRYINGEKWGAILLILALMNGCSAKTDEKAKDEEPKSEQVEEVKTEITVKEQETNVKVHHNCQMQTKD